VARKLAKATTMTQHMTTAENRTLSLSVLMKSLERENVQPYHGKKAHYFSLNFVFAVCTAFVGSQVRWEDTSEDWKYIRATGKQAAKFDSIGVRDYEAALICRDILRSYFSLPLYSLNDLGMLVCMVGHSQRFKIVQV
jgi:hypothetical protein